MPLVRIDVPQSVSPAECQAVSAAVHEAMVSTFNVPLDDRFQTLTRRAPGDLICTDAFLDITHSGKVAFVQITCSPGRSLDVKKALFATLAAKIASCTTIQADDVIINLVETARENWSFGRGVAQYV